MIDYAVRRLLDGRWFTRSDAAELAQELALHAHIASSKYDPSRSGKATFYSRILGRRAVDLTRRAKAAKRDRRRERPLDEHDPEVARPTPLPDTELRLDVDEALGRLSATDRTIAAHLAQHSLAETARLLGLTREQARGACRRVARHLVERGLA